MPRLVIDLFRRSNGIVIKVEMKVTRTRLKLMFVILIGQKGTSGCLRRLGSCCEGALMKGVILRSLNMFHDISQ